MKDKNQNSQSRRSGEKAHHIYETYKMFKGKTAKRRIGAAQYTLSFVVCHTYLNVDIYFYVGQNFLFKRSPVV